MSWIFCYIVIMTHLNGDKFNWRAGVKTVITLGCGPNQTHQDPFKKLVLIHLWTNYGVVCSWCKRVLNLIQPNRQVASYKFNSSVNGVNCGITWNFLCVEANQAQPENATRRAYKLINWIAPEQRNFRCVLRKDRRRKGDKIDSKRWGKQEQ